ncbi:MAG: ATP-binding cassette domain-containing protein [Bryobacteraceae bacterium]
MEKVWKRYDSKRRVTQALSDVSFTLGSGASVALVGASGAGKSTVGRLVAGWEKPDSGTIGYEGEEGSYWAQMIPQDAGPSLNPYLTAQEAVEEPLRLKGLAVGTAKELLEECEVPREVFERPTARLSGGQKARVAIARALAAFPRVLILDESMASLDLITRAQVTDLVSREQQKRQFACIWILHDLDYAGQVASEILVLSEGRIVERAASRDLVRTAQHPATIVLLEARPQRIFAR